MIARRGRIAHEIRRAAVGQPLGEVGLEAIGEILDLVARQVRQRGTNRGGEGGDRG